MREFLRWFGPALQRTYDTILSAPLSWKIIDAHERLRESEEKEDKTLPTQGGVLPTQGGTARKVADGRGERPSERGDETDRSTH